MATALRAVPLWTRRLSYGEMDIVTLAFSSHLKRERDAWMEINGSFESWAARSPVVNVPAVEAWTDSMIRFPDQKDGHAGVHLAHWRKTYPISWWDRWGFGQAAAIAVLATVASVGAIQWAAGWLANALVASFGVPVGLMCGISFLLYSAGRVARQAVSPALITSIHRIASAASDLKGTVRSIYEWSKAKVMALGWMGVSLCILTVYSLYAFVRLYFFPARDCVVLESKIEEGGKKKVEYKPAPWLEQTENLLVYSTMAMALGSAYMRVAKIVGWHNAFFRVIDFFTGRGHSVEPWWKQLSSQKPMFVKSGHEGLGMNEDDWNIPQNSEQASAASGKPQEITFFEKSKDFFWNLIVEDGWQLLVLGVIIGAQYMIYRRMEEIRKQCEKLNQDAPEAPTFTYHWFRAHYAKAIKMGASVPDLVQTRWAELQAWWKTEKTTLEAQRIRNELEKVFKEKQLIAEKRRAEEKTLKEDRKKAAEAAKKEKDSQKESENALQKKIADLESQIEKMKTPVKEEAKGKAKRRGLGAGANSDELKINDIRQEISDSRAKENERAWDDAMVERLGDGRHAQRAADLINRNQGIPFTSAQFKMKSKKIKKIKAEHNGIKLEARLVRPDKGDNTQYAHIWFAVKDWDKLTPRQKDEIKELNIYAKTHNTPLPSAARAAEAAPVQPEAVVTNDPIQIISAHSLVRVIAELPEGQNKGSAGGIIDGMVVTVRHAFTPTDDLANVVDAKQRKILNHQFNEIKVEQWFDHPVLDLSFGRVKASPPSIKKATAIPKGGDKLNIYILEKTQTGIAVSTGEVRRVDDDAIIHSGNTVPGWSGAPLLVNSRVVAIHRGAAGANNTSVLLSPKVLADARKALGLPLN